jgi:tRNA(fMet)-specific endonuclease VapC
MSQPESLLDTDTLSAVLRGDSKATARAQEYLVEHGAFSFSIITRYEILRGLKAKNATAQIQAFDRLCATSLILPLTNGIVARAADIYAALRQRGEPIGDADILIAASALTHGLVGCHEQRGPLSADPRAPSRELAQDVKRL